MNQENTEEEEGSEGGLCRVIGKMKTMEYSGSKKKKKKKEKNNNNNIMNE